MSKIDDFKSFIKNNPYLINYVKKGSKTWQDFYELYDLYGSNSDVWKEYLTSEKKESSSYNFNNLLNTIEKIDTEKLQDSITSMQKALSLFGDILVKNDSNPNSYNPRPVYRRFDD